MVFRILCILFYLLLVVPSVFAATAFLKTQPVTVEKEQGNIIEAVKTFLHPRAIDGEVKVWVFFTDKNIFDNDQFSRAASKVSLTDRAQKRRAKMGREAIAFIDLPVYQGYIEAIKSAGAQLRRQSRWLNAASFEMSLEIIDTINALPFVARIRPLVGFLGGQPTESSPEKDPLRQRLGANTLNYGISFGQLDQINVPAVHDLGITGEGVIVGMFDSGFRKDHVAFADIIAGGRLLAEYDFIFNDSEVQNEAEDVQSQHNHGTSTWSVLGGKHDGDLYGPAFGASFILAKTEDLRSETPVEEDNWLAAVEWADSIGAQVISSSLNYGYNNWYVYSDFDGETAVVTQAANLATSLGIVVSTSMGNNGPDSGTMGAPADAFEILSIGAVNFAGDITSFSSRGPTFDGRIKPEVCARGVSAYCASGASTTFFTYANGTSFSTPLVGGAAALLLSARPSLTPQQVRQALMQTACNAATPDNTYGWGVIDVLTALDWGPNFYSNVQIGHVPLEVSFFDSSFLPLSNWDWDFGDAYASDQQNPLHTYNVAGLFDVSMSTTTDGRQITDFRPGYILALADTMIFISDTIFAGDQAVIEVYLANTQPLTSLFVSYDFSDLPGMNLDTFSVMDTRTADFTASQIAEDTAGHKAVVRLLPTGSPLPPGQGQVLKFFFSTNPDIFGFSGAIDSTTVDGYSLNMASDSIEYVPSFTPGQVVVYDAIRGDANGDGIINVGDPVYMINYVFKEGPAPDPFEAGDANADAEVNIGDGVHLINYIFKNGPPPPTIK